VLFLSCILTVGICAFNEGRNIGSLLKNVLTKQGLPAESEVLVVCSGCTDSTVEIVKKFAKIDSRVRLLLEKQRFGKASAVNKVLANSKGDVILFVSADTLPQHGAFSILTKKIQDFNVGLVNGNPVPTNDSNSLVDRIVNLLWSFHSYVFIKLNDADLARHATEIFCIRNGIVSKIPVETVNDDAYLAVMAKKKGYAIKYSPEAKVTICGPKTFRELFRQRRRIIFGHFQLRKLTGESPQYLLHMFPLHPIWTAKLVLWLCLKYDPLTLLSFFLSEFSINIAAIIDYITRKDYVLWQALPTTKEIVL
jgi:biofilm PGA synthesis N-glycosyltransferase PgaC